MREWSRWSTHAAESDSRASACQLVTCESMRHDATRYIGYSLFGLVVLAVLTLAWVLRSHSHPFYHMEVRRNVPDS